MEDGGFGPSISAENLPVSGIGSTLRDCGLTEGFSPDDVFLSILSLPVFVSVLRAKLSPLVVATDASEWGPRVSRTSSLTAQG